ncbi:hypothetical protein QCD85_01845 [Paenibacillus sp. PsM32]|uniref:hypothetical protein n=1 Tax=Paenibacillus sp. PsM32 TaxID=3030536 RepID=UPI00263AD686|nr:hypothetical protein [Paenibacillus sp. PsM32]MDN4616822.1 hypothetical protein [Paenibacillus sp. PsM32]
MPKVYIINTNTTNGNQHEQEMLDDKKCAAYYGPWKHYIDTIEANDIIFLYSNNKGIIARGVATGIVETKDYNGYSEEEHYMYLDRFEVLQIPLKADKIKNLLTEATISKNGSSKEYKIQWNQTMILLSFALGMVLWQEMTHKHI